MIIQIGTASHTIYSVLKSRIKGNREEEISKFFDYHECIERGITFLNHVDVTEHCMYAFCRPYDIEDALYFKTHTRSFLDKYGEVQVSYPPRFLKNRIERDGKDGNTYILKVRGGASNILYTGEENRKLNAIIEHEQGRIDGYYD